MNEKHECHFCHKTSDLFRLEWKEDDEQELPETALVCGKCWSMIGEIAKRVVHVYVPPEGDK